MGITEAEFKRQFKSRRVCILLRNVGASDKIHDLILTLQEKENYKGAGGEKKRASMRAAVSYN